MPYIQYLTLQDYLASIQDDQLNNQILDALQKGTMERIFAENWAIGKIKGYLSQKYDLDIEIRPLLPFDPKKKYYAEDRCTIDFPAWTQGNYVQGDCRVNNGIGYICIIDNNDNVFTVDNWFALGNQYDIYYIPLPNKMFSLDIQVQKGIMADGLYKVGDVVFWENHTYNCLRNTSLYDGSSSIQFVYYENIPDANIFPNDPVNGAQAWQDNGEFFVLGENPSVDGNVWVLGDNREPVLLKAIIDLSIWMLHNRISPMNIPKLRVDNKDASFAWLNEIRKGLQTVDLYDLQPQQGYDFAGGSKVKQVNGY